MHYIHGYDNCYGNGHGYSNLYGNVTDTGDAILTVFHNLSMFKLCHS